jgi:hypothetical protein
LSWVTLPSTVFPALTTWMPLAFRWKPLALKLLLLKLTVDVFVPPAR